MLRFFLCFVLTLFITFGFVNHTTAQNIQDDVSGNLQISQGEDKAKQKRSRTIQNIETERQIMEEISAKEEKQRQEEIQQAESKRLATAKRQIQQETEEREAAGLASWQDTLESDSDDIDAISDELTKIEKEARQHESDLEPAVLYFKSLSQRIFSLAKAYKDNPLVLEAIQRQGNRVSVQIRNLTAIPRSLQDDLNQIKDNIELEARSIPPMDSALLPYQKEVTIILQKGVDSLKQRAETLEKDLDIKLENSQNLLDRLDEMDRNISSYLPQLWKTYYITKPIHLLDPNSWNDIIALTIKSWERLIKRVAVELPWDSEALTAFISRLAALIIIMIIPMTILRHKLRNKNLKKVTRHALYTSLAWFLLGVAIMASSIGLHGEYYRGILVIGSIIVIWGEMALAWDFRRLKFPKMSSQSPLWRLFIPIVIGIGLIYLDLPSAILAISWSVMVILSFLIAYLFRESLDNLPSLERYLLLTHRIALGISILLTLVSWPNGAILLYATVAAILVSIQLTIALIYAIEKITHQETETPQSFWSDLFIAFAAPVVLVLVIIAMIIWLLAWPGGVALFSHFMQTGINIGTTEFNPFQLLIILSGFYVTRAAISLSKGFLNKLYTDTSHFDTSLLVPLQTGVSYSLWIIFVLFSLHILGFGLENIAMIAGGLSVGIGFGMQTIVNNFLSGLILIFSRTLHEGDVVEVGTLRGTVRKISIRATTVETFDNALIFVPNSEFVSNRLINWTRNSRNVRRELMVGVAYGTDPNLVEKLLLEATENAEKVLKYPEPLVLFSNFGNSTLDFTLRYWSDIRATLSAASNIRKGIAQLFLQNNVDIAFPQVDIHLKKEDIAPILSGLSAQKDSHQDKDKDKANPPEIIPA